MYILVDSRDKHSHLVNMSEATSLKLKTFIFYDFPITSKLANDTDDPV